MSVAAAFADFQQTVNADIEAVREARARRDLFKKAFLSEPDVLEVIPSGSLARGTHKDPIHDVDTIIIYDPAGHPGWGQPGASAAEALNDTRQRVHDMLGVTGGTVEQAVRLARWRNHAVKCFFDDPDDPDGFTVDAMPAFRREGRLLIPEALSKSWVYCDPESLIAATASKHAEWNKFAGTVRMLKRWASDQDIKVKSLVMEVLALQFLPLGLTQSAALKQFFVASTYFIDGGGEVCDPANICGPIQSDLDYPAFAECLAAARDKAAAAMQAQANNDTAAAIAYWGHVFSDAFPSPSASGDGLVPAAAPLGPRPVKDTPQG